MDAWFYGSLAVRVAWGTHDGCPWDRATAVQHDRHSQVPRLSPVGHMEQRYLWACGNTRPHVATREGMILMWDAAGMSTAARELSTPR